MTDIALNEFEAGYIGREGKDARAFLDLGRMYAAGREVEHNLIAAHKWFNLAAMEGCQDAMQLRAEVADELSAAEIAEALKAARAFLFCATA